MAMSCSDILGHQEEALSQSQPLADVQSILGQFEFPEEANVSISNRHLRQAVYDVFGGADIYSPTGEKVAFEDMRIDHFVPKSKGGPDNIFNYVLTTSGPNSRKSAAFDPIAAIPMLTFIRTVYAPKVLRKYQESIAREAREREAARLAAEKKKALTTPAVKPPVTNRTRSYEVVGRALSFSSSNNEQTIRSVTLLREYIDSNPGFINGREIFVSVDSAESLKLQYSDFSMDAAFQFFYDDLDVFSDGRTTESGGGRVFTSLILSGDAKAGETQNSGRTTLNYNPLEGSPFYDLMRSEGGYVIRLTEAAQSLFTGFSNIELEKIIQAESVDISYFRSDTALRIPHLNSSAENLLKLLREFGEPVEDEYSTYYEIDIERAIESGHGNVLFKIDGVQLNNFHGTFGPRNQLKKLINELQLQYTDDANTLADYHLIRVGMSASVFEWLKSQTEAELETTLSTVNLEYAIEIPLEVFTND